MMTASPTRLGYGRAPLDGGGRTAAGGKAAGAGVSRCVSLPCRGSHHALAVGETVIFLTSPLHHYWNTC